MNDEALNEVAGIIALLTIVPATLNAIIYGIGSPWWRSWLGRVLFAKWLAVALVFAFIVLRRALGEFVGYGTVAILLYTFLLAAFTATTVELIIERRNPATIVAQRKEPRMSNNAPRTRAEAKAITAASAPWYPAQRVLRSIVGALVVLVPIVNGVAVAAIGYLTAQTDVQIPPIVFAWLNGAVAITALVIGLASRIMAVPGVNALLVKIGLGTVPKSAIATFGADSSAPIVVIADPNAGPSPTPLYGREHFGPS